MAECEKYCCVVVDEINVHTDSWLIMILDMIALKNKCTLRLASDDNKQKIEILGLEKSIEKSLHFIKYLIKISNKFTIKNNFLEYSLYQKGCIDAVSCLYKTDKLERFNIDEDFKRYLSSVRKNDEHFRCENSEWVDDPETLGYEMILIINDFWKED